MLAKSKSIMSARLLAEIVLILIILVGVLSSSVATQAQAPSPLGGGGIGWYSCNLPVVDVAVFNNRVHVRCTSKFITVNSGVSPEITGVEWLAVPTSDNATSSRYLSLFETALLSGKPLTFYLDPMDLSGGAWGCGTGDCRTLIGAKVGP
jgi:hypothetical protein